MLFNLFGKKADQPGDRTFIDRVYVNSNVKMSACLQLAREQPDIVFVAWFIDTYKIYKEYFIRNGLTGSVVTEAHLIDTPIFETHIPVFLEHYPLHEKETALVENWPYKNILVFSAMDEPLFKHFGSDKMIPLIKLLGMKETEAIEHSFVTTSILKGQQKIADKVVTSRSASSQAEWMEKNMS